MEKKIKILGLGNSFSSDTLKYVPFILRDLGVKAEVANLDIPGCSIDTHYENLINNKPDYTYKVNFADEWSKTQGNVSKDVILSKDWDVLLTQQASYFTGKPETFTNLKNLVEELKKLTNAKLVWNMTWAYQADTTHPAFPEYKSSQEFMYNAILETTKACVLPLNVFSVIVPTGTAIQNARTSFVGDHLTRDGFHMSYTLGRYTVALTFVKSVLGLDISKVNFKPDGLDDDMKQVAIRSAENASASPWKVTPFIE